MGDHLCPGPGADVPPVPPSKLPASYGNSLSDKYDRMPPSLDTNAANGGFMRQGQLTPVSTSSGSRSLSPKTPDSRTVGGRGNDFFEPSIASDSDTAYSQQGRRPGRYGSFSQRDEFDLDPPYSSSPNKQQPSLLSRMDTIAPGPFDGRGNAGPMGNASPPRDNPGRGDGARLGYGDARRPSAATSSQPMPNSLSQRAPRKGGYGGLGKQEDQFEPEPFSSFNRAGTFPRPNNPADTPARTPSAPGPRAGRQTHSRGKSSYGMGPDTSRPPPPRKSLIPAKGPDRSIDLAAEFGIGNPYHSPTASMSSAITSFTQSSGSSDPNSQSTPPRSDGRNPSNTSSIDDLMNDLQSSISEMKPLTPQLGRNPSIGSSRRGRSRDGRSASRDRSASRSRQPGPMKFDQPSFNLKAEVDRYNSKARDQSRPGYGQSSRPQDRGMSGDDRFGRSLDSSSLDPRPRGFSRERQGSAVSLPSRGACKSCGDEIRGKSISSADGRLTGKYHKACFVCTTCRDPFTSAEFYVLNDKPYCELHYHTLNGSLCGACGRGIEGQYLEDENLDKYHVGCFRCGDCSMSLVNGYFDVDGVAYCERDAWRRAQAQQPAYGTSPDGGMLSPAASDYGNLMSPPMAPGGFNQNGNNNRYGPGSVTPSPGFGRGPPGFMGGPPKRPGNMGPPGQRRGPPPGLPRGQRMPPGMGPVARPRMNKRNTRLGMMCYHVTSSKNK
ncbi:uncharacterized protein DNG_09410 [Cephalotrichum gorgonifer]|uniref:LIM zinc-binding domain-containing protein n=1 Tax=Cephalotrichum gorgonifer TaxID=2041049 RepID=A0AAE8N5N0_9PEZI|nr:uncharacterized protein DNG_09410 [Cephalotrichum gorgonifer]